MSNQRKVRGTKGESFDAAIHFAGLKAVGKSVANPHCYFDNNLIGTINLYEIMAKYDCKMIQDYIHVMDLADGHIAALRKLFTTQNIGCVAYNLGISYGTSVHEMVTAFEKVSRKVNALSLSLLPIFKLLLLKILLKIPIKLCSRRLGDATAVYASINKAQKELDWKYI
ncbi:Uncharacterized protein TCM_002268 [Theobroma cacao]|uniref:UDP-glucose 4-epimerase n=1 Tax=Theobroma cacao TaxID=3641 RepID=A0A061DKS9_THECC|nr:Uncharacterized protein TCM_002268 [Theobroma cacao]